MQRLKRVLYWRKQSVDPDVKRFVVVFDFEAFSIEQGFNENAEPGKVAADLRRLAERIEKKDDPLYKEEN